MPWWRRYWVESGIVFVAVVALIFGLMRPRSTATDVSSPPIRAFPVVRLQGLPAFSLDQVSVDGSSRTFGGPEHRVMDVPAGHPITISGWAVDSSSQASAGGVALRLDAAEPIRAAYGSPRSDVAVVLHNQNFTNSGFTGILSEIPTGAHRVSLLIEGNDGKGYYEVKNLLTLHVR